MSIRILLLTLALVGLHACQEDRSDLENPVSPPPSPSTPAPLQGKRAAAARVFAQDTIRTIHLILHPDSLEAIDADPVSERSTGGILVWEGDTARDVGVRYKGAEGAWYRCVRNGPAGGRKICPLSLKVDVDRVHDTTFQGLKSFQLHAMSEQPSLLVETVSYWFVRRMGIPAPRTAHCRVFINGRFEGLYLHVEEMDSRFVDTWQDGSDANLFKEIWPLAWDSTAMPRASIVEALRTNRKAPDVSRFEAFSRELAQAGDSASMRRAVERWVDVDGFLAMAALRLAMDDDDGPFHWYASDPSPLSYAARPHNYYWMEDPVSGRFRLLPWDLDKTFADVLDPDPSRTIEILDPWGTTSHGCRNYGVAEYHAGLNQKSAACDKLVAAMAGYRNLYARKLQATLDGPFAEVDTFLAHRVERLEPVVRSLPSSNGQAIAPAGWASAVADLRGQIQDARKLVEAEIATAGGK